MAVADYAKAYKLGEKEYKNAVSKGQYPYLPVLDEILSHVKVDAQVSLGLVEIPLKNIVGTYSAGRTTAFASNFMPILEPASEFATKWSGLYDDMAENGLRDPIKAFEYNNKFYVMEGNKRVSVSKFMGAVSMEANVTRVIPAKNDEDPDVRLYYEFMDFYEYTGINYLDVNREGTYKKLMMQTGHGEPEKWTDEELQDFASLYTFFSAEFNNLAHDKLNIAAGDALAAYLELYSYDDVIKKSQTELRKDIIKIWDEFELIDNGDEATLVLNPTEQSKKTSLVKIFPVGTPVLKIAFIHDRSVQNSAWTYTHELGRKYVQDIFGDKIEASCIERVEGGTADDVFEAAINAGNKVIFSTSPKHCVAAVKAAVEHPEVKILNCSMLLNHKNIRSYYLRMYEAKFISGALAGGLAENNIVGYLSDYPIRGTTAEINAFALGVQMTNPRAKVVLNWTMIKDKDYEQDFREKNVHIISGRDINASLDKNRTFGLFKVNDDGTQQNLAMPMRHWGKLYEEIIRSIMKGSYKNDESVAGGNALNYFWGMSSGAVDVIYSRNLTGGSIRLLRTLREGIRNMNITPFTGPIYSQDGMCRCDDGQTISPMECVTFDWLAENVEGYIPDISELKDEAVELVKLQGVKNADPSMF